MTRAASGILQPLIITEVTQNLKKSLKKFLNDLNKEIAKRYYDYHEWKLSKMYITKPLINML